MTSTIQRYRVSPWDVRRADMKRDDAGNFVSYDDHVSAQSAKDATIRKLTDHIRSTSEWMQSNGHEYQSDLDATAEAEDLQ